MLQNLIATLSRKRVIAENTTEMTFSVSGANFSFKAGQYISIEIPELVDAPVPDRYHDFSIVSSPINPHEISIVFRDSQSIFKSALLALPIGGVVNIDGPKGVLSLPLKVDNPIIFVAGGIGIAPLLSMIRHATEESIQHQIKLLYCNARKETIAYSEDLAELAVKNPHFSYEISFGAPDTALFAPIIQESHHALWYIVGAPVMVKLVQQILRESGILDTKILIEEFSGYLPR